MRDVVVVRKGEDLGEHVGDFQRKVVDIGICKHRDVFFDPPAGFGLAVDDFADDVDVDPGSLGLSGKHMLGEERIFALDNDAADIVAKVVDKHRHGERTDVDADIPEKPDQDLFEVGKEIGVFVFFEDVFELIGHPLGVLGAETLIEQFDEENLVERVLEHPLHHGVQFLLLLADMVRDRLLPTARDRFGFLK